MGSMASSHKSIDHGTSIDKQTLSKSFTQEQNRRRDFGFGGRMLRRAAATLLSRSGTAVGQTAISSEISSSVYDMLTVIAMD